jgi:protein-disulfide isomerase
MTHSKGAVAAPNQKQDDSASVTVEAPTAEDRDVILGQADAPISIVQYEDFQCPFCGQYFSETEAQLRTAYVQTGKAKIVYRHLAFLGPESLAAAEASECAKDQSKFWEYHDALFTTEIADGKEHNGNLNRALFMKIAGDLKLDTTAFGSCIDSKKYADFVTKQTKEAGSKYGVQSTPTIFVNDQKVEGAYPFATFQQIIDGILKK